MRRKPLDVCLYIYAGQISYSNITSFFRFVNKRAIYRLGIISLAHAPVHVTAFFIVNVHVDELSSARIWQHKLCATLSANINIDYRLGVKPPIHQSELRTYTKGVPFQEKSSFHFVIL